MRLIDRTVDVLSGRVELDTGTFQLTDLERRLFAYLARHPGRDVPREELLTHVWEYRPGVVTRAINATVHAPCARPRRGRRPEGGSPGPRGLPGSGGRVDEPSHGRHRDPTPARRRPRRATELARIGSGPGSRLSWGTSDRPGG